MTKREAARILVKAFHNPMHDTDHDRRNSLRNAADKLMEASTHVNYALNTLGQIKHDPEHMRALAGHREALMNHAWKLSAMAPETLTQRDARLGAKRRLKSAPGPSLSPKSGPPPDMSWLKP